jgi:predicted nucleic acid-binding protein
MRFAVQELTPSILTQGLDIKAKHGFSYWDSGIIAASRALGCQQLYSKDMAHGRDVDHVSNGGSCEIPDPPQIPDRRG